MPQNRIAAPERNGIGEGTSVRECERQKNDRNDGRSRKSNVELSPRKPGIYKPTVTSNKATSNLGDSTSAVAADDDDDNDDDVLITISVFARLADARRLLDGRAERFHRLLSTALKH